MGKWIDENVLPGYPGQIGIGVASARLQVYRMTSGVVLGALVFPALDKTSFPTNATQGLWLNFMADDGAGNGVPFYITCQSIGGAVNPGDPDPTANVTDPLNPNRQCIYVPANVEWHRKFFPNQEFKVLQLSGADAFLRVEATSEPQP